MKFVNIEYLWLFPIIIIFMLWCWSRLKRNIQKLEKFISTKLMNKLIDVNIFKIKKQKLFFIFLGFTCIALGLLRIQYGFKWKEVKRRGVDIIVALDVSKSMNAKDLKPNRLMRAKREIIDLFHILKGDRLGLVAFAGDAFLESPLTLDYAAVELFLDDLNTDLIPIGGTNLERALKLSINSFSKHDKKSRVIIFITDGEDQNSNFKAEVKKAVEQKIVIYTIGIGQNIGAPIPSKNGGFVKDQFGKIILTKLDDKTLKSIALQTGGAYVRSISGDMDLKEIYREIKNKVEDKNIKSGKMKKFTDRFQLFVFFAILFLCIEYFIGVKRNKCKANSRSKKYMKWLGKSIIVFILYISYSSSGYSQMLSSETSSGERYYKNKEYKKALDAFSSKQINSKRPDILKYDSALSLYKLGKYQKAEELFKELINSKNKDIRYKSMYNLANSSYKLGKLQDSVEYYKKYLKTSPKDENAKYNLEFVKRELKKIKKRQQKQKKNKDQKNKDQKNKDQKNKDQKNKDQKNKDQKNKDQKNKDQKSKDQKNKDQKNKDQKNKDQKNKDQKNEDQKSKDQSKIENKKNTKKYKMNKNQIEEIFSKINDSRKKYIQKKFKNKRRRTINDW